MTIYLLHISYYYTEPTSTGLKKKCRSHTIPYYTHYTYATYCIFAGLRVS